MELIIIGIATFFNLAIIKFKFDREQTANALLDLLVLVVVGYVFMGTYAGLAVGTVASALFSLYLIFSPFNMEI